MTKADLLMDIRIDLVTLANSMTEQAEEHAEITDRHKMDPTVDVKDVMYGELITTIFAFSALHLCELAKKYEDMYRMEVAKN